MTSRRCAAFTWVEMLVVIFVVTVLILLALPPITSGHGYSPRTATLSNMKQLQLATQSMALDGVTTGLTNLAWPGSIDSTFANWAKSIVPDYLPTNDFCKLLSASNFPVDPRTLPTKNQNAILVYAVNEEQNGKHVFLTTANFTNTPTGGKALRANAKPFGDKFFVVFRKGGEGAILLANQVGDTNLIGSFAPLLR